MRRIAHATDFSPESLQAFHHALRLAVAARCRLDILHVRGHGEARDWDTFPHVRQVLMGWGMLPSGATPADVARHLGVEVAKVDITDRDAESGLAKFLMGHRPDLVVIAAHGRHGFARWLAGSVSEEIARLTHVPALMIGPESRGFVDGATGALALRRVLMPVAASPAPQRALLTLGRLLAATGCGAATIDLVTVGDAASDVRDEAGHVRHVERLEGGVIDTILGQCTRRGIDLIAMPTAGRHGLLDALRGSTTSRIVAQAPCAVLSVM